jgi:hypothetical protein
MSFSNTDSVPSSSTAAMGKGVTESQFVDDKAKQSVNKL